MSKHGHKKNLGIWIIVITVIVIIIATLVTNRYQKQEESEPEKDSYVQENEDGIKINKSNKLNEAKLVGGLLISNIQLTEKDGMTTLLADVTNKNEEKTDFKKLKIILLDENENEIATMVAFVNGIEAGESTQLNASTTSNYIKAYDFKVVEE